MSEPVLAGPGKIGGASSASRVGTMRILCASCPPEFPLCARKPIQPDATFRPDMCGPSNGPPSESPIAASRFRRGAKSFSTLPEKYTRARATTDEPSAERRPAPAPGFRKAFQNRVHMRQGTGRTAAARDPEPACRRRADAITRRGLRSIPARSAGTAAARATRKRFHSPPVHAACEPPGRPFGRPAARSWSAAE